VLPSTKGSAALEPVKSPIGIYIHIPFCRSKCPYCDFYSLTADENAFDAYTAALITSIKHWAQKLNRPFDTLYFGGGTPSLIGAERLARLVDASFSAFGVQKLDGGSKPPPYNIADGFSVGRGLAPAAAVPEITIECNPRDTGAKDSRFNFQTLRAAGVNRISLGLQSAVEAERKSLGRRGTADDVTRAVRHAKEAGITNISLDLMLGIPAQTLTSLRRSIDYCANAGVTHVSAYMLKIEAGTPFAARRGSLKLPEEDEICEFYLKACEELEKVGFSQYEISNFANPGFESRHNRKYWNCEEYLGIGPAAHSFIDGRRFFYERNLEGFLAGREPAADGEGGSFEEYAMLRLRLNEGLTQSETLGRFGYGIPEAMRERAKQYAEQNRLVSDGKGIRLTSKGFLLSNRIIADLLD